MPIAEPLNGSAVTSPTHIRQWLPPCHRAYPWLAVVAACIMLLRAGYASTQTSHTVDEPYHLGAAVGIYDAHKHIYGVQHPPLPRLVAGLPLVLAGEHVEEARGMTKVRYEEAANEAGARILYGGDLVHYRAVLNHARWAMLIFPAIALLYVYLLGKWLASTLVGMLAVIFVSFDPTLLAHSTQVTTDVAAAAGFLACVYHGLRWIVHRAWGSSIAAGAVFGLAISCKFSTVLVLPTLGLILMARPLPELFSKMHASRLRAYFSQWPSLWKIVAVGVIAFLSLWATYFLDVGSIGDQDLFSNERAWVNFPDRLKHIQVPMPSFVLGNMFLAGHAKYGHATYLNGHLGKLGWWYYFPEAIALKSPLAVLAGFAMALLAWLILRPRQPWGVLVIVTPVIVFLGISMRGHIDLGIRHVLPILPLLYLFVCFVLAQRGRMAQATLLCLIAVAGLETAFIAPNYLSYFNLIADGPNQGDRYLIDSNVDWGQNVLTTAQWLKAQNRPCSMRVTGGKIEGLIGLVGLDPTDTLESPPHGLFAISKNVIHGLDGYDEPVGKPIVPGADYSQLLNRRPLAVSRDVTGYSIKIYDLDQP